MTRSHVHQSSAPWIAALAALALVCAGLAASAGEAKGAKSNAKSARDLYYEPAGGQPPAVGAVVPPPPTVAPSGDFHLGLKYKFIVMDRDGDIRQVNERFRFSSNDRVRFVVESNVDGYLYIFNQGSTNRGSLLFPQPAIQGGDNYVRRYTEYSIPPGQDWFRFDQNTGTEHMYLYLAQTPIAQFAELRAGQPVNDSSWQYVRSSSKKAPKPGSRDLYYEPIGVGPVAVAPSTGGSSSGGSSSSSS